MKNFLDENFLLGSKTAETLYHQFAKNLPIIDYHSHLPPEEIARNLIFPNLTQIWLKGDHYKWRAMRTLGIEEEFITGRASDQDKFQKWAETVPFTLRNPLYHWSHMELRRYFGIEEILNPKSSLAIYHQCQEMLQGPEFSVRNLIIHKNVEVICTTDDPLNSLIHHELLKREEFSVKVLPTFRPDNAMQTDSLPSLNWYIDQLEILAGFPIQSFEKYLEALKTRHDYFDSRGCRLSDHGLERIYAEDFSVSSLETVFKKIRSLKEILSTEKEEFKSALLYYFAIWDHEKGWVQQFHLGALRNNNTRGFITLGADSGYDSMGDFNQAIPVSRFLDKLDRDNRLAKTILYNLNPKDNALMASMVGNFNDGSVAGKIQFGSAWWFLDQKEGMTDQMNTLSQIGLFSQMVGMLTDSRSFLSFPRHEYFRRIVCNLLAEDIESGELPHDLEWTGKIIQDICYYNAKKYFSF